MARNHIRALPALFKKITGLDCHVAWAPARPHWWSERELPTHSRLCRELLAREGEVPARCRRCAGQRLAMTLRSNHNGHRFTCLLGVYNFWLPITVRRCLVGLAFFQTLDRPAARQSIQQKSTDTSPPPSGMAGQEACQCGVEGRNMKSFDFDLAAKLLPFIGRHVESSTLRDLYKLELARARHEQVVLKNLQGRLRADLNRLVPVFARRPLALQRENHAEQKVHAVLDRIQHSYSQPVTLQQCADSVRLNAAYLSDLFAHTVGLPFRAYLTEVRLEKAKILLSDARNNIAEVARAVGYASQNRFRIAFKKATGLSPRAWRQALQVE